MTKCPFDKPLEIGNREQLDAIWTLEESGAVAYCPRCLKPYDKADIGTRCFCCVGTDRESWIVRMPRKGRKPGRKRTPAQRLPFDRGDE